MIAKSPDAFRTISEVADDLDLPQHVLRFWETRFTQIKPLKRGGGRRYYRPDDVDLLRGIRFLLYGEGYTIRGVQRILKEQGPRFVIGAGRGEFAGVPGRNGREDHAGEAEDATPPKPGPHRIEPAFAETAPPPRPRRAAAVDVDREDREPDGEEFAEAPSPVRPGPNPPVIARAAPPPAARLNHDDAERLKGVLAELLELKRLLDQVR
jgi:DNA-binding transcriptional MerR regulator